MFKKFINLILKLFIIFFGKRKLLSLFEIVIEKVQKSSNYFITYNKRPILPISNFNKISNTNIHFAIVVQGPIVKNNSFTFETLNLYRNNYPNAIIILSTWEDEGKEVKVWEKALGIIVLYNSKPSIMGFSNINLQIISTKNGIKKAKELGAEYVIKTRTDQRFYVDNVDQYFINILENFPLKSSSSRQQKRIIGLSLNTFKYRMYGLSDMFIFGHISDMLLYWDIPLDERTFNKNEIEKFNKTLRTYANWRICEVYLMTEFLNKTNHNLLWTIEDSWKVFSNQFCIIDSNSIDLYWGKYTFLENRWISYDDKVNQYEEFSFKDWLNLYTNFSSIQVPEHYLDTSL